MAFIVTSITLLVVDYNQKRHYADKTHLSKNDDDNNNGSNLGTIQLLCNQTTFVTDYKVQTLHSIITDIAADVADRICLECCHHVFMIQQ